MRFCWPGLGLILCGMLAAGCQPDEAGSTHANVPTAPASHALTAVEEGLSWRPLAERSPASEQLFESLAPERTGVEFVNPIDTSHPMKYLYASSMACGGVALGDVDGDGRPDIYFTSGPRANRLFRQTGDFEFEDITEAAGVDGGDAWATGAAMIDIDADGDLDLYVCNYLTANQLYINDGAGRFSEQAKSFGLDIADASHTPSFCDYDHDGDLDLYLLTNRYYRLEGFPQEQALMEEGGKAYVLPKYEKYYGAVEIGPGLYRLDIVGRPDRLLRNDGGAFSDVTSEAGIAGRGHGLSATWFDYNNDGYVDLYVGNDFDDPDHFYRNNGDGTFRDVTKQSMAHTTWFSMGADYGDLNNDGLFDLMIADMSGTTHFKQKVNMGSMGDKQWFMENARPPQYMRNALQLNLGVERFADIGYLAGVAESDWSWAVKIGDLDNDGRQDVFVSNGMARNFNEKDDPQALMVQPDKTQWDRYEHLPPLKEQNFAFRNAGDLRFDDASSAWGLDHVGMSYAAAYADMDRDGDLDLVVVNLDEPVTIYRNNSQTGARVLVQLVGTHGNPQGLGAEVRIETAEGRQMRGVTLARGHLSMDEPLVHFGLGDEQTIRRMTVRWPSGREQTFENLPVDRFYTVSEPADAARRETSPPPGPTMFVRSQKLTGIEHRERPYDDFQREPLLPNKLSQLGPGMAWGDVDGDHDLDVYVGGAAGQAGLLYFNDGAGGFTAGDLLPWYNDEQREDMAALFFDADADGDLDLYIASGGVECEPGDEVLRDRLYLNDGHGKFAGASADALPDVRESASCVSAADFDRDGDLDLFVGGRVIPGKYPLAPASQLLMNDGGKFTDVAAERAPDLRETGLVTSALWSDVDDDGWLDLVVVHEWGPVKVFRNDQGHLIDRTEAAGLAERHGWWNGLAAGDVDHDGDIDLVVTNFGLNTKYHASAEKPALLYYGDFDGSGVMQLVEAEFENDVLFPVRGKSCSSRAMPFLTDKFHTYRSFAASSLQDIYTPKCLEESHKFSATTLESGVLLNDGEGRFTFQPLPRLAQAAPGFGAALVDVDGDRNLDLYMVQNFYTPQIETGRMDGGVSLLLRGAGDGTFTPVWPHESGLDLPGDAKALSVVDLNVDGWPDFVATVNDGALAAFENQGSSTGRMLGVQLRGLPGNLNAVGARVTVRLNDATAQTAEVRAGDSYLAQSASTLAFGLGAEGRVERIEVRWPDGSTSEVVPPENTPMVVVDQPQ